MSLPQDILADIFIRVARDERNTNPPTLRVPDWVNVSYVCRHWRDVALDCPILWTYHFTVSLRWTEELLARSKQASLKIYIRTHDIKTDSWWSRLLEEVLSHADRIEELCLDVPSRHLPTDLCLHVPRLQILDICSPSWAVSIKDGDVLPLRTLKLSGCSLSWHSLNLSRVSTLFLEQIPVPSQQPLAEFLVTLSRMQTLMVLHLDRVLPDAHGSLSDGASDALPNVTLPCLVRLFINAPLSAVSALFSCTDIPLKTQVRLETTFEENASVQIASVVSQRFSQSEDLSSSPTIRSLAIRFPVVIEPSFTISASEHDDCDPRLLMAHPPLDCDVPLMIRVRMEQPMETDSMDYVIRDICCSVPSIHLQNLHAVHPTFPPEFWEDTLIHLDALRRMKFTDGHMPDLVGLLMLRADELEEASSDHPTPSHVFVPWLEELELFSIAFAPEGAFSDSVSEQELREALSTRQELRVTMTACFVQDDDEEE